MDTNILEKIGLTKGEIRIYYALLELGSTTTGPIILKSKVARSKSYEILERLKEKGLVGEAIRENVRYFQAAPPERILDYIEEKKKMIESDAEEFKKTLPLLKERQKSVSLPQEVKMYLGFEGVRTFYMEILNRLKEKDEYLALTFSEKSLNNQSIIRLFRKFHQMRAEKNINAKILCHTTDKLTQKKMNYSDTGLYEFRTTKQVLPTGIAIAGDIVATFNWGETPRVFVVVCQDNAEHYRKFFYSIWKKQNKNRFKLKIKPVPNNPKSTQPKNKKYNL